MNRKIILLALLIFFISYAKAETNLTNCTNITSSGDYVLVADIPSSPESICFRINASNTDFNGNGKLVDGLGASGSVGILVENATNVTIRSTNITWWGDGIYFNNTNLSFIRGNKPFYNTDGINLRNSKINTITNNTIKLNPTDGVKLEASSNNNVIENNSINSNTYGIFIQYSNYTDIKNNNLSNNSYYGAFIHYGAMHTSVMYNNATRNIIGINVYYATNTTVSYNNATLCSTNGITSQYSNYSKIYNNDVTGYSNSGVTLTESYFFYLANMTMKNGTYGVSGGYNGTMENLILQNNSFNIAGVSDSNISNCNITGGLRGLEIIGGNTVFNVSVYNVSQYGIIASGQRNKIYNNTVNITGYEGIWLYPPGGSVGSNISGNKIYNALSYGIYFNGNDSIIEENTVVNSNKSGILVNGNRNNITGNTLKNSVESGIYVGNANDTLVQGNTFSSDGYPIYVTLSNYTRVYSNNISSGDYVGLSIAHQSNYNDAKYNIIQNCPSQGISVWNNSNNNNVTMNTVFSNNIGILVQDSFDNNVFSNNISSNTWDFYSENAARNTFRYNLIWKINVSHIAGGIVYIRGANSPEAPPSGYSDIGKYLEAGRSGNAWLYLKIHYEPSDIAGINENMLRIYKYNTSWEQVSGTNNVNKTDRYVYANSTTFSYFTAMGQESGITILINNPVNNTINSDYFNFTYSDINCTWYSLDGGNNVTNCSVSGSEWTGTFTGLSDGLHSVRVYANDSSGNSTSDIRYWTRDTVNPNAIIFYPENRTYNYNTSLSLNYSAYDLHLSNCWYNLDSGQNITLTNCANATFNTSEGWHTLYIFSDDEAGNINNTQNISFSVNLSYGIIYNNFKNKCNTTNLSSVGSSAVNISLVLDDCIYAKIAWLDNITINPGTNLDNLVNFSYNRISVGPNSAFNRSANITLRSLVFFGIPVIFKDGKICTDCVILSYNSGNLLFNVTGFTSYTAGANSNLTIWDETDAGMPYADQTRYVDQQVKFFANYTNTTSGEILNSTKANCKVKFNISGGWISENMSFNGTKQLWEHNLSFSSAATYKWNVTCNGTNSGYEALETNDTVVISPDNTPPSVLIQLPQNKTYNYSTYLPLNYTVSDNVQVDKCWYKIDFGNDVNLTNCNNATFNMSDGSFILYLYVNDTDGNTNVSNTEFGVDTIPPTITIQLPQNRSYNYNTSLPLNYTVTAADKIWYRIDSGSNIFITTNITFNTSEGSHTVYLYANDSVGNTNFTARGFTADTKKPAITFVPPTPNNETKNNTNEVYINVTLSENPDWIRLEWNGTNITMNGSGALWYRNLQGLSLGNYTFKVYANDSAGNMNFSEARWIIIAFVDNITPQLTVQSPTATTYASASIALNYVATDNIAIDKCWYKLNSDANQSLSNCTNTTITASSGTNTLIVAVNDTSGNTNSTTIIFTYTLQTTPGPGPGPGPGPSAVCGNNVCETGENCTTCFQDCNCTKACLQDWACAEWSLCTDSIQRRTCRDLNDCNNITGKPEEIRECNVTDPCKNGIRDQGEEGVDCGGLCEPCYVAGPELTKCGNGIVDEGENIYNCCEDAGCNGNGVCTPQGCMSVYVFAGAFGALAAAVLLFYFHPWRRKVVEKKVIKKIEERVRQRRAEMEIDQIRKIIDKKHKLLEEKKKRSKDQK